MRLSKSFRYFSSGFAKGLVCLLGFFISLTAFAATDDTAAASTPTDAATMLTNLTSAIPNLMSMVTGIAYVLGMYLIVKGVLGLKQFAEQRTQMSSQHDMKGPLIMIAVGTLLLYLPSSVQVGFNTFWTDTSVLAYIPQAQSQYSVIYQDAYMIIELIGTIAFIRGLLTLTHLSGQGGQQGTFAKAMAFIISGIFCINLYSFLQMLSATLGVQLGTS